MDRPPLTQYRAPGYLFNRHLQTIVPGLLRRVSGINYERQRITTPDDDFLDLDWMTQSSNDLVILSHGLEGNSQRPYIKGMARAFFQNGYDILAWNFRGCSGEVNRQLRFYHSGATDDLHLVVTHAINLKRYKNIFLIGFSLGGNLTLKYLGEQGKDIQPIIEKAVVFSVPLNLYAGCMQISKQQNFIYTQRFLYNLKKKVRDKAKVMPQQLAINGLNRIKNLYDFDDAYTAPLHGFKDAMHYYDSCSSINFLSSIQLPTLIINARNDPFLPIECFPEELTKKNPHLTVEYPEEGGHCGFYTANSQGVYWSEMKALNFVRNSQH